MWECWHQVSALRQRPQSGCIVAKGGQKSAKSQRSKKEKK